MKEFLHVCSQGFKETDNTHLQKSLEFLYSMCAGRFQRGSSRHWNVLHSKAVALIILPREAHTGVWKECSLKPTFLLLLFWSLSEKRALTTGLSFVWRTQSSFSQLLTGKGLSEKFLSQSQGMKVGREEQISSLCCKVKTPDS